MAENREVKSDVFSMLMEDKENALSVYNALNDSDYKDADLVEMKTLEKGISLTIRNDAAFIVDMSLNIYEHQSTYSPNIPLRYLIYLAEILKPMIKNRNIYGHSKVKIPTPKFAVFYNGKEDRPEKEILKLSDLFEKPTDNPEIELICEVRNINPDKDREILKKSQILNEYMTFIEKVREYAASEDDSKNSISMAIDWCIENHILENFLRARKAEVLRTMTLDMTFEHREEMYRDEIKEMGDVIANQSNQLMEQSNQLSDLTSKNEQQALLIAELEKQLAAAKQA